MMYNIRFCQKGVLLCGNTIVYSIVFTSRYVRYSISLLRFVSMVNIKFMYLWELLNDVQYSIL